MSSSKRPSKRGSPSISKAEDEKRPKMDVENEKTEDLGNLLSGETSKLAKETGQQQQEVMDIDNDGSQSQSSSHSQSLDPLKGYGKMREAPTRQFNYDPTIQKNERPYRYVLKKPKPDGVKSRIFIGAESFEQFIRKSYVLADRTVFLKELLDSYKRNLMFCLPPGVGKTMMITMAKSFFELPPRGVNRFDSDNYKKLFAQKFENSRQFAIIQEEKFVEEHFACYPVLHFCFSYINGNKEEIEEKIGLEINKLFLQFGPMVRPFGNDENAYEFQYKNYERNKAIKEVEWTYALNLLTNLLYERSGKECMILVDDYDAPIINEKAGFGSSARFKEVIRLVQNFVSACEHASHVYLLLLFGNYHFNLPNSKIIVHIAKSAENNQPLILRHFGFTEAEFNELCDSYCFYDEMRKEAKQYYNGHGISGHPLFSVCSTMSMLESWIGNYQSFKLKPHFCVSHFMRHFNALFKRKNVMQNLMRMIIDDKSIELLQSDISSMDSALTDDDAKKLLNFATKLAISSDIEGEEATKAENLFMKLLFQSGYLSIRSNSSSMIIPNIELKKLLEAKIFEEYFQAKYKVNPSFYENITSTLRSILISTDMDGVKDFRTNLSDRFNDLLNEIVKKNVSLSWSEHLCHSFLAISAFQLELSFFGSDFPLYSQKRPDIILCNKWLKAAICIEVKFVNHSDKRAHDYEYTPEYALYQIWNRHYLSGCKAVCEVDNLEHIFAIGFSCGRFTKKEDPDSDNDQQNKNEQLPLTTKVRIESSKRKPEENTMKFIGRFERELKVLYKEKYNSAAEIDY